MRKMIIAAAALGLAACNQNTTPAAPVANSQSAPETGAALQVAKLNEDQRNGVFERAIRASGATCPSVTASQRFEIRTGVKGWKAQCDDGNAHLIELMSDGTAKVTSRTF